MNKGWSQAAGLDQCFVFLSVLWQWRCWIGGRKDIRSNLSSQMPFHTLWHNTRITAIASLIPQLILNPYWSRLKNDSLLLSSLQVSIFRKIFEACGIRLIVEKSTHFWALFFFSIGIMCVFNWNSNWFSGISWLFSTIIYVSACLKNSVCHLSLNILFRNKWKKKSTGEWTNASLPVKRSLKQRSIGHAVSQMDRRGKFPVCGPANKKARSSSFVTATTILELLNGDDYWRLNQTHGSDDGWPVNPPLVDSWIWAIKWVCSLLYWSLAIDGIVWKTDEKRSRCTMLCQTVLCRCFLSINCNQVNHPCCVLMLLVFCGLAL